MERQVVFEVDECTIRRLTDVICFPILVDSPDSLTMKHLLDVCTYFSHSEVLGFSAESCFIPYPSHYKAAFAFSNFSLLQTLIMNNEADETSFEPNRFMNRQTTVLRSCSHRATRSAQTKQMPWRIALPILKIKENRHRGLFLLAFKPLISARK